jgi:hypothetical protein
MKTRGHPKRRLNHNKAYNNARRRTARLINLGTFSISGLLHSSYPLRRQVSDNKKRPGRPGVCDDGGWQIWHFYWHKWRIDKVNFKLQVDFQSAFLKPALSTDRIMLPDIRQSHLCAICSSRVQGIRPFRYHINNVHKYEGGYVKYSLHFGLRDQSRSWKQCWKDRELKKEESKERREDENIKSGNCIFII